MDVKVSVIVLTYNQEKTINRTIDSIINQNVDFYYEIIIGDDASTDGTRDICRFYAEKYDHIHLLLQKTNKGVVQNYIECLGKVSGKYIMGCAGDDWWGNTRKMGDQVHYLDSNPDCALVFGGYKVYNEISDKLHDCPMPIRDYSTKDLIQKYPIAALTICFRNYDGLLRELQKDIAIAHFPMEDYPLSLLLSRRGRVHCMGGNYATYSISRGSISNCSTLFRKEKFEMGVFNVRLYYYSKFGFDDGYTLERIKDTFYLSLSTNGIRYNDRKYCVDNIAKIKHKRLSDIVKFILASTNVGFRFLRYINKKENLK